MRVTSGIARLDIGNRSAFTNSMVRCQVFTKDWIWPSSNPPAAWLSVSEENAEAFLYLNDELVFTTRSQEPVEVRGCTVAELMGLAHEYTGNTTTATG